MKSSNSCVPSRRFLANFWFKRTSKIGAVEGVIVSDLYTLCTGGRDMGAVTVRFKSDMI